MTQELLAQRPKRVLVAARLLYVVVFIGVLRTAMTIFRHADVRSPGFLIFTKMLLYAVSAYLIYEVGKGRNWARWSLLALLTVSIPLGVLPAFDSIAHSPVDSLLALLQLLFYAIGMVFLFRGSASNWFHSRNGP